MASLMGKPLSGLLCHDMQRNEYHPSPPTGPNPLPRGVGGVMAMAFRLDSNGLYVGGKFLAV